MSTEPTPETARALLWRHNLPEDVIDGVLCLHAQELAAVQLAFADQEDGHLTTPVAAAYVQGVRDAAARIVPGADEEPASVPVVVPPADRAAGAASPAIRRKLRQWAYAAGHIEPELDGAVDRMYALIAQDVAPAALPATDRATTLRWAADQLEAWQPEPSERWTEAERNRYEDGVDAAADQLRRLAGEARQDEVVPCVRPEPHPAHSHSGIHRERGVVHGRCPGVPARAARQDPTPDSETPAAWEQTSSGTWTLAVDGGYVEVPEHITAHERAMFLAEWQALRAKPGRPGTYTEA
ncbi:hypothetical protein [Streptomyces sp. NPDC051016]|uniref:hypothetical protein n=1 Tax=Streptomyces sp. NPDC051016 TaxID=3365638 RepID=UPI0037B67890